MCHTFSDVPFPHLTPVPLPACLLGLPFFDIPALSLFPTSLVIYVSAPNTDMAALRGGLYTRGYTYVHTQTISLACALSLSSKRSTRLPQHSSSIFLGLLNKQGDDLLPHDTVKVVSARSSY